MCSATRSQAAPCGPGVLLVPLHFPGSLFLPRSMLVTRLVYVKKNSVSGKHVPSTVQIQFGLETEETWKFGCPETMQPMPASGIMLLVWHKLQKTRLVT
ncbi:hypothetical protein V6N13_063037 [Hibiscus sabdariffa]